MVNNYSQFKIVLYGIFILAIFESLCWAQDIIPSLSVEFGQNFTTLSGPYQDIKQDFEKHNPETPFPGLFIDHPANLYGLAFGIPVNIKFSNETSELQFPTARFVSIDFDDQGSLDSLTINPQLEYAEEDEIKKIDSELSERFRKAGWEKSKVSQGINGALAEVAKSKYSTADAEVQDWYYHASDQKGHAKNLRARITLRKVDPIGRVWNERKKYYLIQIDVIDSPEQIQTNVTGVKIVAFGEIKNSNNLGKIAAPRTELGYIHQMPLRAVWSAG